MSIKFETIFHYSKFSAFNFDKTKLIVH